MPYANDSGVRIHYQVEGEGPVLVLQHGFGDSVESWYELGYVDALKRHYRLILMDARGHGASDKPHDPEAYALHRRVGDIVAVLDTLGTRHVSFWGYSMGAWIGFGIAKYAPERFQAMILGGSHPYARSMEELRQLIRSGIAQGREAFITGLEEFFGPGSLTPADKARHQRADLEALLALAQDRPPIEDVLPTMTRPCLLYVGEADAIFANVKQCAAQIPNVTFISLPGLNHAEAFSRSDLVLPGVHKFLTSVHC